MTLTELLPSVQQLSPLEKLQLIRILAEDLETCDQIAPFVPHKVYQLSTPYDTFGAGRALITAMRCSEDQHS